MLVTLLAPFVSYITFYASHSWLHYMDPSVGYIILHGPWCWLCYITFTLVLVTFINPSVGNSTCTLVLVTLNALFVGYITSHASQSWLHYIICIPELVTLHGS